MAQFVFQWQPNRLKFNKAVDECDANRTGAFQGMLKSHSDASINLILTSTSTPHSEHIDFTAAGKVVLAQLRREKTMWRVEVVAAVVVVVAHHVLYVCVFESVWLHGWERYYAKKDRIHSGPRNYNGNDCITQGGSCVSFRSIKNEIKTNLKIKQQEWNGKGHLEANASRSSMIWKLLREKFPGGLDGAPGLQH